ncbi:MAG TPA: class I SAM-dependent methyltransferase [Polyangia bacterium]|nr:class I SAM-dependent methyltransferase [Polyangia bacterium]
MPPTDFTSLEKEWDRHSAFYHLVYGDSEAQRTASELAFLRFAFERFAGRPVRDVLDLTAGTGAQALALAAAGYRMTAADISGAMLERCAERAATSGVGLVALKCRAAHETDEVEAFDACISCFFGLCHLLEETDLTAALTAARRALRPGGILIFDAINLLEDALVSETATRRSGISGGTRFRSAMESRYDTWNRLLHFSEEIEITDPHGDRTKERVEFTYRDWSRTELLRLLEPIGWSEVRAFRGWDDRGDSREERVFRTVLVCRT